MPDQPAPGARSDQFANAGAFEVPGHGVAARACTLVDDHHLRPENSLRLDKRLSHAVGRGAERLTVEDLRDVGGQQAAAVEALVHNRGILSDLRIEVAVECGQAAVGGVRHVDVGDFPAAHLVDFAAILLDPGQVPQSALVGHGHNGYFARFGAVRIRAHTEHHGLAGEPFEKAVDVGGGTHVAAIHRQ